MYFPESYYVDFYISNNNKDKKVSNKNLFINQIQLTNSIENASIFNSKFEDLNNELKKIKPNGKEQS